MGNLSGMGTLSKGRLRRAEHQLCVKSLIQGASQVDRELLLFGHAFALDLLVCADPVRLFKSLRYCRRA